jgi:hypothetical protein
MTHENKTVSKVAKLAACTNSVQEHAKELEAKGYHFEAHISKVALLDGKDVERATVEVGLPTWLKVTENPEDWAKSPGPVKNLVRKEITGAIEMAYNFELLTYDVDIPEPEPSEKVKTIGELIAAQVDGESLLKAAGVDSDVLTASPVFLRHADTLGQPVRGSSNGSVYHVVALGDAGNLAVRIDLSNKASLRIEGEGLDEYEGALSACGMEKQSDLHWSIHTHPSNFVLLKKLIGAVVYSSGIPFKAAMLDIEPLVGKGK